MIRILLCLAIATLATAADWTVGWKTASERAASEKKVILADFSGSDWCILCVLLKKEVFDTPEFTAWAKDRVVLLEVDFPIETPQPEAVKAGNRALAEKYSIEGYPSVLLLDANGTELGRLTYKPGGAKPWIASAEAILAKAK